MGTLGLGGEESPRPLGVNYAKLRPRREEAWRANRCNRRCTGLMGSEKTSAELREIALKRGAQRRSFVVYRFARGLLKYFVNPWLRLRSENAERLNLPGPTVLAPVHRSNLDSALVATLSERRIRALGKESLFRVPGVSYLCAALGAIPVRRGAADRDALSAARTLLKAGETMIVFPEGGRQSGSTVAELFDGAAWLASRTAARVTPIGIHGTEDAMPAGTKRPRRARVVIVVGEPMEPPVGADGGRISRGDLQRFTNDLKERMQLAQDRAVELASNR